MSDAADLDLATLVRDEVARQSTQYQLMVVDSVQEDGTINLRWGDAVFNGVVANQSYNPRAEGDTVLVLKHTAGWRVIDRVGAPATVTTPDATQTVEEAVELTFSPNKPQSGAWAQGQTIWVADGKIHVQTGVGPGEGDTDGPTTSVPKPVTITPTSAVGYRKGAKDTSRVAQGAAPEYPVTWTAIWTYGDLISKAVAKGTVAKIEMRVARTSSPHGAYGKVRAHLGLHGSTSAPSKTPSLGSGWDGPSLGLGQSVWTTLPASQTAALVSGAKKGIGAVAGVGYSKYLIFTAGCGNLRFTYK